MLQKLIALGWPVRILAPLLGRFVPWHPEHRRDPYPTYRRLRETAPVHRTRYRVWVVSRYDDVAAILRDRRFTADRSDVALVRWLRRFARLDPEFLQLVDHNLLNLDGAKHARLRGLVNKAFTPRRVEALRPRVQALVDELLDRVAPTGEMEVVRDLAHPLPVAVIAEMLGVPLADREKFRHWSEDLVQVLDPLSGRDGLRPTVAATHALFAYFRELLAERRARPRDDLLSALIAAEDAGRTLEEGELLSLAALLLAAGHETTTNLIGNALLALLAHPGERKRLADDAALAESAVEELLRWDGPVQLTERVVAEDLEFAGRRMRRGQLVWLLLASANRDPAAFPEPDRLDLGRRDNRHLAFGQGAHFCLGAPLASLEAQIALGTLVRRFPDLDGPLEPPGWKPSAVLRGPTALPLVLGAPRS